MCSGRLSTVTVIPALVVEFPKVSVATLCSVYVPLGTSVVSQAPSHPCSQWTEELTTWSVSESPLASKLIPAMPTGLVATVSARRHHSPRSRSTGGPRSWSAVGR